jgi:hypothetical protein
MVIRVIVIIFALILVAGVLINSITPPGSHPWPKADAAKAQIEMLESYANDHQEVFKKIISIDNASFVTVAKTTGAPWLRSQVWKYNSQGELLDPWGSPYLITRKQGQINIASHGLDQYNKLSDFQKWWSNE